MRLADRATPAAMRGRDTLAATPMTMPFDATGASFSRRARRLALGAALPAVLAGAGIARADDKQACVAAYRQAQISRNAGELVVARTQLRLCAREECPAIIKQDCVPWLDEVERAIPSIVAHAKDASGNDLDEVTIQVDDEAATRRAGQTIELNPGTHVLRFEAQGLTPVVRRLTLRGGEKQQSMLIRFGAASPPSSQAPAETPTDGGATSPVAWVFTGIGVLGGAGFATLGLMGNAKKSDLEACKPNCSSQDVGAVKLDYVLADVSLLAGIIKIPPSV